MFKSMALGITLALAVGLVGAYVLVESGYIPANADARPGRLETWMAHTSLRATLKREALARGFRHCEAGPLVRSSYHAHEQAERAGS